jgi:hypothetical protein
MGLDPAMTEAVTGILRPFEREPLGFRDDAIDAGVRAKASPGGALMLAR